MMALLHVPGTHFLLGGTTIHRSQSFLHMMQHTAQHLPPSVTQPPPSMAHSMPHLRLGPVQLAVPQERRDLEQVAMGAMDMLGRVIRPGP